MQVKVERAGVPYTCTNEAQLQLFLDAGYKVVEDERPKAEKKKAVKKD